MTVLPGAMASVLDRGAFCHVAARTDRGPHLTPMVFAFSNDSVWVTTSRGSVKARAWRSDPTVAGLVRNGHDSVSFVGRARPYDLLDAGTWLETLGRTRAVASASLRFSSKNARFFAGYAVDARHVPLAWTPPARVFVELEIDSAALVHADEVVDRVGGVADVGAPSSRAGFRAVAAADAPVALPGHVRRALGRGGAGALAVGGRHGAAAVVPVRWRADDDGPIVATAPVDVLALAADGPAGPAALGIDRPSSWRARRMLGCMIQATADVFVPSEVRTGRRAVESAIARAGGEPHRDGLVRLRPTRVVWWEGWTSGSSVVA